MTTTPHFRAFPVDVLDVRQQGSGERTLTGRLVPYNVVADVVDITPEGIDLYREGFRPGAFSAQVRTGSRSVFAKVGLIHRHEGGLGYLGPFSALREEADGLYGDAVVLPTKATDVEALLRAGIDELSIEFRLPGKRDTSTVTDAEGVRWRTRAHLDQVALEPKGAYSTAQVMAYRAEADALHDEDAEHDAEMQAQAEAIAEAEAEQAAIEAAAEEAIQRREAWDALCGRIPTAIERQREYLTEHGITIPSEVARDRFYL